MKFLQFFFIYILTSINLNGQNEPLKNYYVVDSSIYKNKVKFKFDTLNNPPKQKTVTEYDSLGREIEFYYVDHSYKYKRAYKTSADTILCFVSIASVEKKDEKIIEIQKYLYDSRGNIILATNSFQNSKNISAKMTKFIYDSLGRMEAKYYYYAHNFSNTLNEHYSTNSSSYNLNTVEKYFHDKEGRLVVINEITGPEEKRFTDSMKYNKQGKLITVIRYQKYGAIGELRGYDYRHIVNYSYTDSSWIKYESSSFGNTSQGPKNNTDGSKTEYVFSKNGLINKEYLIRDNIRLLYRKYNYSYFE